MNIEDFRSYCLSFKGVTEKMPFDKANSEYDRNLLVFSVMDKWFCFANIDIFDFCTIKCNPESVRPLQDQYYDIVPAYHMNKKHWISVWFNRQLSDDMIRQLVWQSYELVVASLPRKLQKELSDLD